MGQPYLDVDGDGVTYVMVTQQGVRIPLARAQRNNTLNMDLLPMLKGPDVASGQPVGVADFSTVQLYPAVSNGVLNGTSPWSKLFGPNEIKLWTKSGELSSTAKYVTAQSASNGPAMFRREGASIFINGADMSANFGNLNTNPGLGAGALANKTIAILVYWHRLNANSSVILRVGKDTGNYVTYAWRMDSQMLNEGWNLLLVSTKEPIGNSPVGQNAFQTAFSTTLGWQAVAGTFDFSMNIGYVALELQGTQVSGGAHDSQVWFEGVYAGAGEKARITIGFDIQTNGLDLAKSSLDAVGFKAYAAVPTANGNSATPEYVWTATDINRLQMLYASGWDIIQHSVSHNPMGNYADDGMLAGEIAGCRDQIVNIGCPRAADLFATPNSSSNNRLLGLCKRMGVKWCRTTGQLLHATGISGMAMPLKQGNVSLANITDTVRSRAFIDLLVMYGATGHLFTHGVITGPSDSLNTNVLLFQDVMSYIKQYVDAGLLDVILPSDWLALGNATNRTMTAPNRLPLAVGTSPYDLFNTTYDPVTFVIAGGTVSAITYSRDGSTFDATGETAGFFVVQPGDRLRITYTVAPTVIQYRMQ